MDSVTVVAVVSIATAGITTGIGCMCPALGEGRAVATALTSLAQQPDASATITRTLFSSSQTRSGVTLSLKPEGNEPCSSTGSPSGHRY
jgi:F0F1-type ATP synthase membrane subunit c/vacuolar-type H+-ATPase subunit K